MNKSNPLSLTLASIIAFLAWLVFILLFAVFWSNGFNLFQDIVILIASIGIVVVLIGLMWFIWGRKQWNWWTR